jgi:hypothetical protein
MIDVVSYVIWRMRCIWETLMNSDYITAGGLPDQRSCHMEKSNSMYLSFKSYDQA